MEDDGYNDDDNNDGLLDEDERAWLKQFGGGGGTSDPDSSYMYRLASHRKNNQFNSVDPVKRMGTETDVDQQQQMFMQKRNNGVKKQMLIMSRNFNNHSALTQVNEHLPQLQQASRQQTKMDHY